MASFEKLKNYVIRRLGGYRAQVTQSTYVGATVTPYSTTNMEGFITHGYAVNADVFSIINQQAKKSASVPILIKKVEDEKALSKVNLKLKDDRSIMLNKMYLKKALGDEVMDLPLKAPNPYQTWTEFIALYKTQMKLFGNVYILKVAPTSGKNKDVVKAMYLLPAQYIKIVVDRKDLGVYDLKNHIKSYDLFIGSKFMEFDPADVMHIRYPNPLWDVEGVQFYGYPPLRSALMNLLASNTAIELNIRTLKSGGAFGFIHGKNEALTELQAKEIKDRLLEMNDSPENLSKIAGISAEIGFTRLSLTNEELRPFEYLKFDQKQLANVLNWSDKLLNNDEGAKYDNVIEFRKQIFIDDIIPDLQLLENVLNDVFIKSYPGYENSILMFDYNSVPEMQIDVSKMVTWLGVLVDKGVISRDEVREAIDFEMTGLPHMEQYTTNSDLYTVEEAVNQEFITGTTNEQSQGNRTQVVNESE
jgi:HK97 family phage portal protein